MVTKLLAKLPPVWRYVIYLVVALALLVYAALQASNGDWKQAIGFFLTSLSSAMAATNTGRTGLLKVK